MKRLVAVAGIAFVAACAESTDPTGFEAQHTIDVPGNTVGTTGCVTINHTSCFAILDNQLKILYERNSWAARRGEAEYRTASAANKELSYIFQGETRSVDEALRSLDSFIADISAAIDRGSYSACWGDHILTYAQWIRGKVAAGNVDISDVPQMSCQVSPPAGVSASGSTSHGVALTIDDPWHFSGDPYGVYFTSTYFVVQGPGGTITTAPVMQTGAATVVVADTATRGAGTHQYIVTQCADWGPCSAPLNLSVTIAEGSIGAPACVHDNRDKAAAGPSPLPKCAKGNND